MTNDNQQVEPPVPPEKQVDAKRYIANYELNGYKYDSFWAGRKYEHESEQMLLNRIIKKYVTSPENESIIDLGGSYGRNAVLYRELFKRFVITDYSTRELAEAKETLSLYKDKMDLVALNAYNLPFKSSSVDNVLCVRLIHHIATPEIMFREISRVMKPGGLFILEVAHKHHSVAFIKALLKGQLSEYFSDEPRHVTHNPSDSQGMKEGQISLIFAFSANQIRKQVKEAGFEVLEVVPCSFFRNDLIKRVVPLKFLLGLESFCQRFLFWMTQTPSLFFVLKKNGAKESGTFNRIVPDNLQCPKCGKELALGVDKMTCATCSETFAIKEGIYDLRDPKPEEVNY